ncbi:hypothetical protein GOP47_0020091 [Adiantum capillus-veneris]|uniref:Imidazoleglycerol-phosphate dehydratase n=1 Tax=Adiantum capillus-veneris TaxID=13818 RepID=A0A9D4ZA97_ADICA|nr:hypothetical protein GOP47_0020091 [Adiantum capillus-veneris]
MSVMQVALHQSTSLQSSSSSSSTHLLHGCLALKLATCLRPPSAATAPANGSSLSDDDCIVGPYCPRFCFRSSVGVARSHTLPAALLQMQSPTDCSFPVQHTAISCCASNGAPILMDEPARIGEVGRKTKETDVNVRINLDGTGVCQSDTGIPFLDHMLDQIASHGLFDVNVTAKGDLHIDDHHTNEDIALAFGTALLQALGDRKGISRFGDFTAPLDEALVHVVLDLSGRPFLAYDMEIPTERVGTYDTQLVEHFFQSLVNTSGMTLHIRKLSGKNSHHIIEACFKAFARALRKATEYDVRRRGSIPSSKGVLSRA